MRPRRGLIKLCDAENSTAAAAGFDPAKLRAYLQSCAAVGCIFGGWAQARLDRIDSELRTLDAAGYDPTKLRAYQQSCAAQGCLFGQEVQDRLARFDQAIGKFTLKDNRDIWLQDIRQPDGRTGITGIDINACAAQCDGDPTCKAFSFDRWTHTCYPKNSIPENSLLDARSTIGVKKPIVLPNASQTAQLHFEPEPNKRFRDTPIIHIRVPNAAACQAACEPEFRCVTYTFSRSAGGSDNCEMFNLSSNRPDPDVSADSGFKYQQPP